MTACLDTKRWILGERRLIDKSPLTDRIWNIDPAGHEEGLVLLLLLFFFFQNGKKNVFYLPEEVKKHANPIFYPAEANADI